MGNACAASNLDHVGSPVVPPAPQASAAAAAPAAAAASAKKDEQKAAAVAAAAAPEPASTTQSPAELAEEVKRLPPLAVLEDPDPAREEKTASATMGYQVAISVIQGRNIKKMDLTSLSDPYVVVTVNGKSPRKTKHVNNTRKPVWNQRFVFDRKVEEGMPTSVEFSCFNRNTVITSADLEEKEGKSAQSTYMTSSHVLALTVHEARGLRNTDVLSKPDAYAKVAWGGTAFKTKYVPNSVNPKFQRGVACFWVDQQRHKNYKLEIGLFDHDEKQKDDTIGFAYLEGRDLFTPPAALVTEGKVDVWLPLDTKRMLSDRDVAGRILSPPSSPLPTAPASVLERLAASPLPDGKGPAVRVSFQLLSADSLQERFFSQLIERFDTDGSGKLSPLEILTLCEFAGIKDLTLDRVQEWCAFADEGKDGELDAAEVMRLLMSQHFVGHTDKSRLLHYLVEGVAHDNPPDLLMEGVTQPQPSGKISVKDRASGLMLTENIPTYIQVAMKVMFSHGVGRVLSTRQSSRAIMAALSAKQGAKYNKPESRNEIPGFIRLHDLNVSEIEKPVSEYATFNEFFARKLKPEARPIASPDDPNVAVIPADCRLTVFADIQDATKYWIKGDEFTLENLLGPRAELAPQYLGGSLVIARLAPQDYHRWHTPVDGAFTRKTAIPGALYTVNPIAVNANVNVYTKNKREIWELDSPVFDKVLVCPIGATMVGSIVTELPKGTIHGYFAFGGSTVLLLFKPNKIAFDVDLLENSRKNTETLVRVNTQLGVAVTQVPVPTAAAVASEEKKAEEKTEAAPSAQAAVAAASVATEGAAAVAAPVPAPSNGEQTRAEAQEPAPSEPAAASTEGKDKAESAVNAP